EEGRAGRTDQVARRSATHRRAASDDDRAHRARDQAQNAFQKEDRSFQLLKDVAENLAIGYDVGKTLVAKLKQTHDARTRSTAAR
ncbi:MAG: hypothetical protein ABIP94_16745, partial [Planctomycetota bacterium]